MNVGRRERHEEAVSQLRQLLRGVQGATAPAWLELDLSMGQLRMLFALQACGTTSLVRVAERLGVGSPTASVLVDQLVRLGFVDGRRTRPTVVACYCRSQIAVTSFLPVCDRADGESSRAGWKT